MIKFKVSLPKKTYNKVFIISETEDVIYFKNDFGSKSFVKKISARIYDKENEAIDDVQNLIRHENKLLQYKINKNISRIEYYQQVKQEILNL